MVAIFSAMHFLPCWLRLQFSRVCELNFTVVNCTYITFLDKAPSTRKSILLKFELALCLQRKSSLTIIPRTKPLRI